MSLLNVVRDRDSAALILSSTYLICVTDPQERPLNVVQRFRVLIFMTHTRTQSLPRFAGIN
jgi:hypothetical protein